MFIQASRGQYLDSRTMALGEEKMVIPEYYQQVDSMPDAVEGGEYVCFLQVCTSRCAF